MKQVLLAGESIYDLEAIRNLLRQKYNFNFRLLKTKGGGQIDSDKFRTMLNERIKGGKFDFFLIVRDLDGLKSEKEKWLRKTSWFDSLNKENRGLGLFLLNIYELEALILADIETFNREYGVKMKFSGDPMSVPRPKRLLNTHTKKAKAEFKESRNPALFSKLNIEVVKQRCGYFKEFISQFNSLCNPSKPAASSKSGRANSKKMA